MSKPPDLEPPPGKRQRPFVSAGYHREISRIVELAIDVHAQHADRHLVGLHDDRHRRRDHVGRIGAEQKVHFVDAEQLGVDAGHVVGVALVVVINQLDRAPQQSAPGVDVVAPDFQGQQVLLAVGRDRAGQGHAEADLDWIGRSRRGIGPKYAGA